MPLFIVTESWVGRLDHIVEAPDEKTALATYQENGEEAEDYYDGGTLETTVREADRFDTATVRFVEQPAEAKLILRSYLVPWKTKSGMSGTVKVEATDHNAAMVGGAKEVRYWNREIPPGDIIIDAADVTLAKD